MCVNIHTAKYSVKFLTSGPTEKTCIATNLYKFCTGNLPFFRIFNVISVYAVNKVVVVGKSCSGYGAHVTS